LVGALEGIQGWTSFLIKKIENKISISIARQRQFARREK